MDDFKPNELSFHLMVEASPNALLLVNSQGRIAYLNNFAESLFQYSKNELIGKPLEILIPNKFKDIHPGLFNMYFKNPTSRQMGVNRELYAVKKDGLEFPVEIGLNPIVTVDGTLVLAAIIDITERKKTDLQFRLVVESVPNAIILIDSTGVITMCNHQSEKLFGYSNSELVGGKLEMLIPERYRTHHRSFREMFFQKPETRAMGAGRDLFALRKDGSEFPAEIGLNPIVIGTETRILTSIIDITARKKLERHLLLKSEQIAAQNDQLKKSEQSLKELNTMKNKLFSIIGHDLRGPIGGLKSLLELIINRADYSNPKRLAEILHFSHKSASSTFELLENLLLWARSQQNEITYSPTLLSLSLLFDNTSEVLHDLAKNKEIQIINNIPKHVTLLADKNMLLTIFRNLISNAIKFTHIGKYIYVSVQETEIEHTICIEDEGVGIRPEILPNLFSGNEQISTTGTESEKGSGLGLLLCNDFVEKHGGKIWVESELGKGSAFYFTIPKIK